MQASQTDRHFAHVFTQQSIALQAVDDVLGEAEAIEERGNELRGDGHYSPGRVVNHVPGRLPNAYRLVMRGGGNARTIWAEGDGLDPLVMPPQDQQALAARRVPQADRLVIRGGDDAGTIGIEGDRE